MTLQDSSTNSFFPLIGAGRSPAGCPLGQRAEKSERFFPPVVLELLYDKARTQGFARRFNATQ